MAELINVEGKGKIVSGNHDGTFHGRAAERDVLAKVLDAGSGVVHVEGDAGVGKTCLLTWAARDAARRGYAVETAADVLDQPFLLARLAQDGPVEPTVIVLDDLHLADPGTLAALRSLLPGCHERRVVWLLAGDRADDRLLPQHATRITLEPLPDNVVSDLVTDFLGGKPDTGLRALASLAQGNPARLVALLTALREDGQVHLERGRAALRTEVPPRRVEKLLRERLDRLSERARHLLQVASVLGQAFEPGDVAQMLGTSTAILLPVLDETIGAGVVTSVEDRLAFGHELIWRLVSDSVPAPVRRALHREAGEMLLARGDSAVTAAQHLLHGAQRGDVRSIEGLVSAATAVLRQAPDASAELAVRALELTDQTSEALIPRTVVAVRALAASGKLTAAQALAQDVLGRQVPAQASVQLRHVVALTLGLSAQHAEAIAILDELLDEPDLPEEVATWVEITRLLSLLGHDAARAGEVAETVARAHRGPANDLLANALAVLSVVTRDTGQPGPAAELAKEAANSASGTELCAYPQVLYASQLGSLREFAEADAMVRRVRSTPWRNAPKDTHTAVVQSRILLQAGRLEDAVAEARGALAAAEESALMLFVPPALAVLATAAVHTGDLPSAIDHVDRFRTKLPPDGIVFSPAYYQWTDLLVSFVGFGLDRVLGLLSDSYGDLIEGSSLLVEEPRSAAWFVRRAQEAGDIALAEHTVRRVEQLADDNPSFRAVAVAAIHARGLIDGDAKLLEQAAAQHRDLWARANAAEDLGALLAASDRAASVKALENALGFYREIGAIRDSARVMGRLRKLGRRRRTQPVRPLSGWSSLDDTEQAIANLVAKGQTNRQISAQLFMSPHTVNFHLRKIFRKLGISSRVELVMRTRPEQ
ncbi:LuxR C-terminal-related transcriptional regulator [Lentzea sp. NBRC 105346]|uniref:helix-turn-helix transcriptional regulator n=1 Tax=Lentzea sp. NBRC 105346 TaxID=3032205 RepID=UPI0025552448|nr:LuxR C-terminal-related transcriptional regulator [Lentzea sp. NBRC 105346]